MLVIFFNSLLKSANDLFEYGKLVRSGKLLGVGCIVLVGRIEHTVTETDTDVVIVRVDGLRVSIRTKASCASTLHIPNA